MPKINDHNLYNIDYDYSSQAWTGGGWKALAKYGADLGVSYARNRVSWQILFYFHEVYEDMADKQGIPSGTFWDVDDFLTLAAFPKGKLYSSGSHKERSVYSRSGAEEARLRRLLKRVITAFVNSKSLSDALYKINEENWQRFAKCRFHENWIGKLLSVRIGGQWVEAMNWLVYGLQGREACEEAFWSCVWVFTKSMITELMKLKRCIVDDIPFTDEQLVYLNYLMEETYPHGSRIVRCDGSETYEVYLERKIKDNLFGRNLDIRDTARIFLTQSAFSLAQELQRKCLKSRFVGRCRAPSCGNLFYTGRDNATACPSKRSGAKSACALKWIRYRRYLMKIRKDPEKDWDNEQLQKKFISYDKS